MKTVTFLPSDIVSHRRWHLSGFVIGLREWCDEQGIRYPQIASNNMVRYVTFRTAAEAVLFKLAWLN